jgi:CRISPR-associated protein Csm4
MKTYILPLKQKSGLLSDLQSDTIYGHFCWRLKEKLGDDKLTEFISTYDSGNPIFTISDGLINVNGEIRFPRPFIFIKPEVKANKTQKVLEFVQRKVNKERNFLNTAELNGFLNSGHVEIEEKAIDKSKGRGITKSLPVTTEALRVSVQIDRNSFGSSESRLFSYSPSYARDDVSYVIFIRVFDESNYDNFACEEILKETFSVGYGKKKSSGYGQFEVDSVEEFGDFEEPQNTNAFMVLGNYLPSKADEIEPIAYEINIKYGKLGEGLSHLENPFKNPIIFLTAGSVFRTYTPQKYYGRTTQDGEISSAFPSAVQFGTPLTLNVKLNSHVD